MDILCQAASGSCTLIIQLARLAFQLILKILKTLRSENLTENGFSFIRRRQQQLQKITLCNHGNLHKLIPIDAHDLPHSLIHLPWFRDHPSIRKCQLRIRTLCGYAFAAGFRSFIFRITLDIVNLLPIGKNEFHFCRGFRLRVFGTEHGRFPVVAAGFPVKGKGNSIKKRGFTRAGITRDQVQALGSKGIQIEFCPVRVGSEGGYGQFQRSHDSSSQVFSISSFIYAD